MTKDLRIPKLQELRSRLGDQLLVSEREWLYSLQPFELDIVLTITKRAYRAAVRDGKDRR